LVREQPAAQEGDLAISMLGLIWASPESRDVRFE